MLNAPEGNAGGNGAAVRLRSALSFALISGNFDEGERTFFFYVEIDPHVFDRLSRIDVNQILVHSSFLVVQNKFREK